MKESDAQPPPPPTAVNLDRVRLTQPPRAFSDVRVGQTLRPQLRTAYSRTRAGTGGVGEGSGHQ